MNKYSTFLITPIAALAISPGLAAQNIIPATNSPAVTERGDVVLTVGPDDCDYDNLQEAIESPQGAHEIRVHVDYEADNGGESGYELIFADISGGLQDCSTGEMSGTTTLNVDGNGRVFQFNGGLFDRHLTLRDLNLVNGSVEGNGGGIYLSGIPGDHSLTLKNVRVGSNSAIAPDTTTFSRGGGIYVEPAPSTNLNAPLLVMDNSSLIQGNQADYGGGLACYNQHEMHPRMSLVRIGTVGILQNHANEAGGGIDSNGCPGVTLFYGSDIILVDSIYANSTNGNGGGISARSLGTPMGGVITVRSGSFDENIGDAEAGPQIVSNSADGDGGGIFVQGGDSQVSLQDTLVSGNSADFRGEAAFVSSGTLAMEGARETPCDSFDIGNITPCSRLMNHTIDEEDRPIIQNSGTLRLLRTYVEGHEGDGPVILNEGTAELESVLVRDNDVAAILRAWQQDAENDVRWSTFSGNETTSALLDSAPPINSPSDFRVLGSILWDPGNEIIALDPTDQAEALAWCVIGHQSMSDAGFTHFGFYSEINPQFVAAHDGDYRLEEFSPAIDYCNPDEDDVPELLDLDGNPRGIAADTEPAEPPSSPQSGGIYDLGAFEYAQLLFRDRFEEN